MLTGGAFYTRDGYKPIKEIQKGDKVYSRNEKTGEIGLKKVEEVFCTTAYTVYHVWIDGNEEFKITAYHPVYVHEQGWITAINLREGDVIETIDGCAYITKIGKIRYEEPVPVYNFHVKDWLSYFVGLTRIYIHNTDSEHDKKIWKAISRKIEAEGMDVSDWNKGTFDSVYDSLARHYYNHHNDIGINATSVKQYLDKAKGFRLNLKGTRKAPSHKGVEGAIRYSKNGKYIILAPDKTIISYGKVR